jgi:hypothetical protein
MNALRCPTLPCWTVPTGPAPTWARQRAHGAVRVAGGCPSSCSAALRSTAVPAGGTLRALSSRMEPPLGSLNALVTTWFVCDSRPCKARGTGQQQLARMRPRRVSPPPPQQPGCLAEGVRVSAARLEVWSGTTQLVDQRNQVSVSSTCCISRYSHRLVGVPPQQQNQVGQETGMRPSVPCGVPCTTSRPKAPQQRNMRRIRRKNDDNSWETTTTVGREPSAGATTSTIAANMCWGGSCCEAGWWAGRGPTWRMEAAV